MNWSQIWPADPSLGALPPYKICGNSGYVQRLVVILVSISIRYLGAHAASDLDEILLVTFLCGVLPLCKFS